jgi:hypothetical protein
MRTGESFRRRVGVRPSLARPRRAEISPEDEVGARGSVPGMRRLSARPGAGTEIMGS